MLGDVSEPPQGTWQSHHRDPRTAPDLSYNWEGCLDSNQSRTPTQLPGF